MEVILLERVDKLGQMGEVVTVKPGFARNYLLSQKKAMRATKDNVSLFESRRDQLEADNLKRRGEAMGVSTAIEGLSVILTRQASDSYQLYGSVTTRDIAAAAIEAGFTVTQDQIELDRPIKSVGLHPVRVRLHPEVVVTITVNVARTQDEAEAQARGETIGRDDDDDDNWGAAQAVFGDRAEAAGDETAGDEAAGAESTGEDRDDG